MSIPQPRQAGIIDIGSNSVRLVICDVLGASILQSFNEKVMAGLGEGLTKTGHLSPQGIVAALAALGAVPGDPQGAQRRKLAGRRHGSRSRC